MQLLRDELRTARKHYQCDAYYWFDRAGFGRQDVDADDWLIVEAVRSDRGKILPSTKYIYQVRVDGGEFWIFRARPEIDAICRKYDLYPED
ncbi:hypothetical protein RIM32_001007 [Pseudomonas aeruginosa]|nr:hypothetical protein [Pseudomonas aeruginosa]MBI8731140.1 hypothetical protein [Pseudomonas aeruginosa]